MVITGISKIIVYGNVMSSIKGQDCWLTNMS
jgi:hypothetical protein